MLFTTPVTISPSPFSITYNNSVLLAGSCFTTNIGNIMRNLKFNVKINPFGILYNPASLNRSFERICKKIYFTEDELVNVKDRSYSFDFHGDFSAIDPNELAALINKTIDESHKFIATTDVLIITIGTAWVFRYLKTLGYVANCHKVPGKYFERTLLNYNEVITNLESLVEVCRTVRPDLKIIFTVSPVKHLRDGIVENSRSKALLNAAVHQVCDSYDDIYYFPSYEIVNDELRDYRFYSSDMAHPSETAVEFIWERFGETFFCKETKETLSEIESIQRALSHKPFLADGKDYRTFLEKTKEKLERVKQKALQRGFDIDFASEETLINERLSSIHPE